MKNKYCYYTLSYEMTIFISYYTSSYIIRNKYCYYTRRRIMRNTLSCIRNICCSYTLSCMIWQ